MNEQAESLDTTAETEASETEAQETEARKQGWRPKDEWNGKGKWRDAEDFLERGKFIDYRRKSENLEAQVGEMRKAFGSVKSWMAAQNESKDQQIKALKDKLTGQQADAIVAGDRAAIIETTQQIAALDKAARSDDQRSDDPAETPEARAFTERNADWLDIPRYAAMASSIAGVIREKHPDLTATQYFVEIEKEMRVELAEREGKIGKRANSVESENERGGRKTAGKRTFDALPADAKAAFHKQQKDFELMGHKFTKDDYVKFYKWDE